MPIPVVSVLTRGRAGGTVSRIEGAKSMASALIEVTNLRKKFGDLEALRGISLDRKSVV